MHKQITLIQVSFDQRFILLSVLSRYDQVIFRGYKPVEFFEPEYFPHPIASLLLLLPVLDNFFDSVFFGVLDRGIGGGLGLLLLFI